MSMSVAAVTYRAGTPEDGAAMLSIHTRAIEFVAVRDYGEEMARSWAHGLTIEGYARSMADGEIFEVAVCDGRVVGFCGYKNDEICGLYVDPDFGRRGIASRLLERALRTLQDRGHRRVKVDSSITASPFYRQRGFRVIRERTRMTRGGMEIPTVDLEWHAPDAQTFTGTG
ncbi:MAG: GNAT family N-acetyltransferase [Rhizobiales bacterium]|nr:GNAT family N-acetyltransferase [Hyphomicrobiales bacterium]